MITCEERKAIVARGLSNSSRGERIACVNHVVNCPLCYEEVFSLVEGYENTFPKDVIDKAQERVDKQIEEDITDPEFREGLGL